MSKFHFDHCWTLKCCFYEECCHPILPFSSFYCEKYTIQTTDNMDFTDLQKTCRDRIWIFLYMGWSWDEMGNTMQKYTHVSRIKTTPTVSEQRIWRT
jgi:hypothetical protein